MIKATSNTSLLSIQVDGYNAAINKNRKLSLTKNSSQINIRVTHFNQRFVNYNSTNIYKMQYICENKNSLYKVTKICPNRYVYNITCPANSRILYDITCPYYTKQPECVTTNASRQFNSDHHCEVIAYDNSFSTCSCYFSQNLVGRTINDLSTTRIKNIFVPFKVQAFTLSQYNNDYIIHNPVIALISLITLLLII